MSQHNANHGNNYMQTNTCEDCGKDTPNELQAGLCPECQQTPHKHKYFLKQDSFSMQKYHRECDCGKKVKVTNYKISK